MRIEEVFDVGVGPPGLDVADPEGFGRAGGLFGGVGEVLHGI